MESKRWMYSFVFLSATVLMFLALFAFVFDPYMQYRITEGKPLFLNSRLANAGIIKNYSYNAAIIGSSMVQNFNMGSFREELKLNPIKVTKGGISLSEIQELTELVNKEGRCENFYICADLYLFTYEDNSSQFPNYLVDSDILNDYKYLLGYETWMRFIPVDIALGVLFKLGIDLPEKFADSVDIDKLEDWSKDYLFGKDILIKDYMISANGMSAPNTKDLYERMTIAIDQYLESINLQKDKNYTFFFPPYSALYWFTAQNDEYFDTYMSAKTYIIEKLKGKENVTVFDFQSMPQICDLDNYKDMTHYSAEINELMVDCFKSGEYIVTDDTIDESISKLELLVEKFAFKNSAWLAITKP